MSYKQQVNKTKEIRRSVIKIDYVSDDRSSNEKERESVRTRERERAADRLRNVEGKSRYIERNSMINAASNYRYKSPECPTIFRRGFSARCIHVRLNVYCTCVGTPRGRENRRGNEGKNVGGRNSEGRTASMSTLSRWEAENKWVSEWDNNIGSKKNEGDAGDF